MINISLFKIKTSPETVQYLKVFYMKTVHVTYFQVTHKFVFLLRYLSYVTTEVLVLLYIHTPRCLPKKFKLSVVIH